MDNSDESGGPSSSTPPGLSSKRQRWADRSWPVMEEASSRSDSGMKEEVDDVADEEMPANIWRHPDPAKDMLVRTIAANVSKFSEDGCVVEVDPTSELQQTLHDLQRKIRKCEKDHTFTRDVLDATVKSREARQNLLDRMLSAANAISDSNKAAADNDKNLVDLLAAKYFAAGAKRGEVERRDLKLEYLSLVQQLKDTKSKLKGENKALRHTLNEIDKNDRIAQVVASQETAILRSLIQTEDAGVEREMTKTKELTRKLAELRKLRGYSVIQTA